MVSSSLDKSIKKTLAKDTTSSSSPGDNNTSTHNVSLPPDEKIQLLFPKCRPRTDYLVTDTLTTTTDLISITTTATSATTSKLSNNNPTTFPIHKQMKLQSPLSPDHKKNQQQHHHSSTAYNNCSSNIEQPKLSNNNYVETNPFRIGSNNRYFYAQQSHQQQNDSLFNNNSSTVTASASASSNMHHYHYQNYSTTSGNNYFLEPDEIEHNPYMDVTPINTIPSAILKTTPPDTPPALQPCTTPVDSSPLGSSRNLWDLSPIKSTTPTRIKTQSPSPTIYSRPHRGSYKKLLASPVPIEEDLETGHYYYNNKKPYYQAPQTDSDNSANEPATFNDIHEIENKMKAKAGYFGKGKMRHSESSDVIYAEVRKNKDERNCKMVKSKSGSGIMGE